MPKRWVAWTTAYPRQFFHKVETIMCPFCFMCGLFWFCPRKPVEKQNGVVIHVNFKLKRIENESNTSKSSTAGDTNKA